ncbi:hypothetical protein EV714DRAFT_217661 [Schizophyllum commune]
MVIDWTPGSIWTTYPYSQHEWRHLGWQPDGFVNGDPTKLRVRASYCSITLSSNDPSKRTCAECLKVPNSDKFRRLLATAVQAAPHTPHSYLHYEQIRARLRQALLENKKLRTIRIATAHATINDMYRILRYISENDIRGIRRLFSVALDNGASPHAMLDLLERSVNQLYRPASRFNQRDLDKAFLVKALGGPRLLHALMKADGYPSLYTLNRRHKVPEMRACVAIPTEKEIWENFDRVLDPAVTEPPEPRPSGKHVGVIAMIDGVALEEVCRYCGDRDAVLGVCREHGQHFDLYDVGMKNLEVLELALKPEDGTEPRLHWGKDGTVIAIATLTDRKRYIPIPLLLSPSCKAETGEQLAQWLNVFISVWHRHPFAESLWGPIRVVASDGESSFRVARFKLGMTEVMGPDSFHGHILTALSGFNCQTGPSNLLGTCDFKHVIKRGASWLRSNANILVRHTVITPLLVLKLLKSLKGMSPDLASDLMDPADKMNVPKAVWLFDELSRLQNEEELSTSLLPALDEVRRALSFAVRTFRFFILPFTNTRMCLMEQSISLATYGHITAAMNVRHKQDFMGSALYADSQAIVKAIFTNILTLQEIDSDIEYFIIQDGTDREENLFSNVRTQDHSRNFDTLQLSHKLSISAAITAIFIRNPDLDRGHPRRNLSGAFGVDKVNPASWDPCADLRVGSVDVRKAWEEGEHQANTILREYFGDEGPFDFASHFASPDRDFLRPNALYVGSSHLDSDKESDDLSQPEPSISPERLAADEGGSLEDAAGGVDDAFEMLEQAMLVEGSQPGASRYLDIDGTKLLKDSVLPKMLSAKNPRKVVMRTLRAIGIKQEEIIHRKRSELWDALNQGQKAGQVQQGDPVACLIRCRSRVCLAVLSVISFEKTEGGKLSRRAAIDCTDFFESGPTEFRIVGQVALIEPRSQRSGEDNASVTAPESTWIWTGDYLRVAALDNTKKLTQKLYTLTVPASQCFPLGASLSPRQNRGAAVSSTQSSLTWTFESSELAEIMQTAWEDATAVKADALTNISRIPLQDAAEGLPYRDLKGNEYFYLEDVPAEFGLEKLNPDDVMPCKLCDQQFRRGHADASLIPGRSVGFDPCGWCGEDGCLTQMTFKGKKRQITSNCRYHYPDMIYGIARKRTQKEPCTNVPIHCPLCPTSTSDQHRTVWKYNAPYHIALEHGTQPDDRCAMPAELIIEIFISRAEEQLLGIEEEVTAEWREENRMPDTDGFEQAEIEVKSNSKAAQKRKGRAESLSIVEPDTKRQIK